MARKKSTSGNEPLKPVKIDPAKRAKLLAQNAVQLAEFAATALIAAKQLRIKTKPLENFTLSPAQREVLLAVLEISRSIKTKLKKNRCSSPSPKSPA